jgi:ATP-dependent Clp protease ATP-binding subunit ClpB
VTGEPAEQPAPGRAAHELMPLWTVSLGWELRRGRQVILHGEVNDRYWLDGQPASFRDVLTACLLARGTDIVGWWDPVDGLVFPEPRHQERFDQVRDGAGAAPDQGSPPPHATGVPSGQAEVGPAPAGPQAGVAEDGEAPRPTSRRAARDAASQRVITPTAPARLIGIRDVLGPVRQVVSSPRAHSAFVLQDIDVALPGDNPDSPLAYLRLRAAMDEAVVPHAARGKPPYARNAVILVTGSLSRLPPWFYQEDPRIEPLRIARPDTAERRLWLSLLRGDFNGQVDIEPLVGATDGLAGWHVDALARTSVIRNVPARNVTKLLDAYRFNVRTSPWTQLDANMVRNSGAMLARRVVGQDRAVEAVVGALQAAYVGVDFGSSGAARPRGVFFFVGPTGVGKTELAKAVAALIFGDESAYARFDMSEYQQEHAAERLAGAPPGFIGFEQGGELTRRVQERPFSVLLFDEIEKAHPAVLDKFLQILEDGRLTDGRGQTAYFSQSLIIFTSNTGAAGLSKLMEEVPAGEVPYEALEQHFLDAVKAAFDEIRRPEIFGRVQPGVVVFDMLRPQHIAAITDRLTDQLVESVRERQRAELIVDRAAVQAWMTTQMAGQSKLRYGGRQIRNEMEALKLAVVRYFVDVDAPAGTTARLTVSPDGEVTVAPACTPAEAG